ncbi:MAG: PilW family protein [Thermodesulfobacteriota bacterium]
MRTKTDLPAAGFTLVELLIAMLLTGIISIGIFSAYKAQQANYIIQEEVAEMQQRVRAGLDMMVMELRLAGYNPECFRTNCNFLLGDNGEPNPAIIDNATTECPDLTYFANDTDDNTVGPIITFGIFADDDGIDNDGDTPEVIDEANEMWGISYSFEDTDVDTDTLPDAVMRTVGGGKTRLIEGVDAVEFLFEDEDGNLLPVTTPSGQYTFNQRDAIRAVTISILARAVNPDPDLRQNRTYTLPSGVVTPAFTDRFRRRLVRTTVQFRNLGVDCD